MNMFFLDELFTGLLNMEWAALCTILIVLALRLALKKAPRTFSYALWAVVGFRLACPISFESAFSLLPSAAPVPETITLSPAPAVQTNLPPVDAVLNAGLAFFAPVPVTSVNPLQVWFMLGALAWLAGAAVLLLYTALSTVRLRYRLRGARLLGRYAALTDTPAPRRNVPVFAQPGLASPFVCGLLRPRIYLPEGLPAEQQRYILRHEMVHIRRGDTLWKLLAWLLVCAHWLDPLVWLAFALFEKDMELSCDEAVLAKLGPGHKKAYAETLLALAGPRRRPGGCPVAFVENGTKSRIRSIAAYQRPAALVCAAAFAVVVLAAAGCLANPKAPAARADGRPEDSAVLRQDDAVAD